MLFRSPARKQFFSIDLEGSSIINTSQMIQVGTGRVGLANNFTLRNRNIGKKAIQLENNLRTGIEFNNFQKILAVTGHFVLVKSCMKKCLDLKSFK